MTDRELLELAAKAAKFGYGEWVKGGIVFAADEKLWNPLTNDGDALRLAVKKSMSVRINTLLGIVEVSCGDGPVGNGVRERLGGDHAVATRRAIVRAAASIEVVA